MQHTSLNSRDLMEAGAKMYSMIVNSLS